MKKYEFIGKDYYCMGCQIDWRDHALSVNRNVTIYSIACKEEDNVLTLVSGVY